jgi:hypothetical protein
MEGLTQCRIPHCWEVEVAIENAINRKHPRKEGGLPPVVWPKKPESCGSDRELHIGAGNEEKVGVPLRQDLA